MRRANWSVGMMIGSLTAATFLMTSPVAIAAPAAAPSVAGTWKGPFLGYTFTFEFKQAAGAWTGRYQSDKANKWVDLQNLAVADVTIFFFFVSSTT